MSADGTLTLASIRALAAMLRQRAPVWNYYAVRPDCVERLRAEIPLRNGEPEPLFAVGIYEKPGQREAAWAFRDSRTLRDYLGGKLTEGDLILLQAEARQHLFEPCHVPPKE